MRKKQKNCINNLLKRKRAFVRFVKLFLERAEAQGLIIMAIVSYNGEFEWLGKYEDEQNKKNTSQAD